QVRLIMLIVVVAVTQAAAAPGDGAISYESDWVWPAAVALVVALSGSVPYFRTRRARTVFVSYRRSDSMAGAKAVRDRVARRFGERRVFFDVHTLDPGDRFAREIDRSLRQCDAALVIIGPTWTSCEDGHGALRLHQP